MIADQRIIEYIDSLESSQGSLLDSIEREARETRVPVIRRETGALLRTLIAALSPSQILEIGTAVGYSALLMCRVMPEDCRITTIENYEKRIPVARENFRRAGEEERFDLVFLDAAKAQYAAWLPSILNVMPAGSVLVSDNVLQDGEVALSRFALPRRDRTIHSRMREYLYELKHNEILETAILPVGDGVAVSTRVK